jgi:hypothetical protein
MYLPSKNGERSTRKLASEDGVNNATRSQQDGRANADDVLSE